MNSEQKNRINKYESEERKGHCRQPQSAAGHKRCSAADAGMDIKDLLAGGDLGWGGVEARAGTRMRLKVNELASPPLRLSRVRNRHHP